ncbi:TPA: hypothetical protein RQJ54_001521 [Vibrio vulnificus]|nr:hypothetical protein [Vibrio parahaemolyticus]HAV6897835.1 hypothetical protein [Vibrio vulnificus]HDY7436605.1 hypothetical protein [Vibrio vulnificus]HDY7523629.1 hypothetical protein [Vibrio vulnificus]
MKSSKLTELCSRLLEFELTPFIMGVSSGQIAPEVASTKWMELKNKAQNNQLDPQDLRELVTLCNYERLELVFELIDELEK